jgi:hypothetical protein
MMGYTFTSGLPWEDNFIQDVTPKLQFQFVNSNVNESNFLVGLMVINVLALMLWVRFIGRQLRSPS